MAAIFVIPLLCAVAGMLAGNRVAGPLLLSFVGSTLLVELGSDFSLPYWVAFDLIIILAAWLGLTLEVMDGGRIRRRNYAILSLYVPIWGLYIANTAEGAFAIDCIVAVQLCLLFPARCAMAKYRQFGAWLRATQDDRLERLAV